MTTARHILINALAMGGGGGFTVGREILRHLAIARPDWKITFVLVAENPLHEGMRSIPLPQNCQLLWAPARTLHRTQRGAWEKSDLVRFAHENKVDAVIQLNGMLIPGMKPPTLCHMQDPWPYRSIAWTSLKDRIVALLKRRAHRYALKHAAAFTFTSGYLKQLITGHHRISPAKSEVAYNGVPDTWIARAQQSLPRWDTRPNELITVSNIGPYKRHNLVIEALPLLLKTPGLSDIRYRITGAAEPGMKESLTALAQRLNVSDRVIFEGRVSEERLAEIYSNGKCFTLMSVCESFGIPAIEAMSFGTPVVTADCCAMPEVCGGAAELSPVDDVQALADRIAKVMLNPAVAEPMRQRGALQAAKFSWTPVGEQLARIIESITPTQPQ